MKIKDLPQNIKPFACHGMELHKPNNSGNWLSNCPYCSKERKFYVNEKSGQWDCKVCGANGNIITFITDLSTRLVKNTTAAQYRKLGTDRGTTNIGGEVFTHRLSTPILKSFKVGFNQETAEWCIPCFSARETVKDLRHWSNGQMMATAGIKLQLGGENRIVKSKGHKVWICEGEWDAIWLYKLFNDLSMKDVVCWLPGAGVFKDDWIKLFKGKEVVCVFDADKAGDEAQLRAYKKLKGIVKQQEYVNWPEQVQKGFDLRDFIIWGYANENEPEDIIENLEDLIDSHPRRFDAKDEDEETTESKTIDSDIDPIPFKELVKIFEKHVSMDTDMLDALKVAMAVAMSNDLTGDPLWMYLIGPPGCGKTLLLSAMQSSARCKMVSTITPHALISGWRGSDNKDPSLIPQLKGKTFIAKDFTEILDMPPFVQDEIFGTLRGAFDGIVEKFFGNGVIRTYDDCHFSMIAGVTNAINGSSKASLGERFLKFQMKEHSDNRNSEIVHAAIAGVGREKLRETELQEATKAFLANTTSIDSIDEPPKWVIKRLTALVQLIAILRAQVDRTNYSDEIKYRPIPEAGTRLAKQLVKLGYMLAVVEGKKEIDEEIYSLMERVAYNTANEFHLNIINIMMELGGECTKTDIVTEMKLPFTTVGKRIDDLEILKAIRISEGTKQAAGRGGRPARIYEVSNKIAKLWKESKWKEAEKKEKSMLQEGGTQRKRKSSTRNSGKNVRRTKSVISTTRKRR